MPAEPRDHAAAPSPARADASLEPDLDLRAFWRVLIKRRQLIAMVLGIVLVSTAILTFAARPQYLGTTQILIERRSPKVLPFQELTSNDVSFDYRSNDMFYETQLRLLQSKAVALRIIERLKLRDAEEFAAIARGIERGSLTGESDLHFVEALLGRVQVAQIKNSRLFNVSYLSSDPQQAAAVANALAETYIQLNQEVSSDTSTTATASLEDQIRELQESVRRHETELQVYARENRLVYLDDKQNVALKALKDLNDDYNRAHAERIDRQARHQALRRADPESIPEVLSSGMIGDLKSEYARLAAQQGEMSSRYGPDWPQMREITTRMKAARDRLDTEIQEIVTRVVKGAEVEYQKALEHEQGLRRAIRQQTDESRSTDMAAIRYRAMKADLDSKKVNLDALLKRAGEAGISAGVEPAVGSNVRIIDRASIPSRPHTPRKARNMALGLLFGLLGGVAAAFFLEYLDNTVKTAEEAAQITRTPILAQIPVWSYSSDGPGRRPAPFSRDGGKRSIRLRVGAADGSGERSSRLDRITALEPDSPASEAFRELRTSLLLSSPDSPPRAFLVTSAVPRDGKTTVAANLAIALAQSGRRVLLVDADLRRPRLHHSLELPNAGGIGAILAGTLKVDEAIQPSGIPDLDLLSSGPLPPNPAEVLGSATFRGLLTELLDRPYDHLVFDSGPALTIVDPLILASQLEGVVLVLRAEFTPRHAVREVRTKLAQSRARLLGCVLNGAVPEHGSYQYRYGYAAADTPRSEPPSGVRPAAWSVPSEKSAPADSAASASTQADRIARLEKLRERISRQRASS